MKILHIIPGMGDSVCGIAVAALAIAERQRNAGDTVSCVDASRWTALQIKEAEEVWVHSMWMPSVLRACLYIVFRAPSVRLVRMPHGCLDPVKLSYHWYKKCWVRPLERFLFRRSGRIISTVESETEWIKSFAGTSVPVELVSLDGSMPRPAIKKPKSWDKLLFVGRLHPLKGLEYLLRAISPSHRLVVIGRDDGEGDRLRALAAERRLNVDFRGVVSAAEKDLAFAEADVLVLPTLSENYGLVVAEALQHGIPVITTDGAPAWKDQDGVIYLEGYREGTDEQRVAMLEKVIRENHSSTYGLQLT